MASMPVPTAPQLAWQEAELGAVFHYDLHVFDSSQHYQQHQNRLCPYEDPNLFNPTELDTDQWIETARDMGARFAILTASHETGFRLWQSEANPYCLKAVRWGDGKRDLVGEFVASCRRYGIAPGIYMGTRWNSQLGLWDFKVTERSPLSQEAFNALIEREVEEICTGYGDLFEIWFDGGAHSPRLGGPDVRRVCEKHQPNCLFYHNLDRADARWGGTEQGVVPYPCWATFPYCGTGSGETARPEIRENRFELLRHGDPDGTYWMPAMSDTPLRTHEWFWSPGDEHKLKPLEQLVECYYGSVGHNSTLIVGLTPDNRGLMPEGDARRCREWGDAIRQAFANEIASTSGEGEMVELALPGPAEVRQIVIQEEIRQGERVREFAVEAVAGDLVTPLSEGTCIGHKRIIRLDGVEASAVRLRVTKSTAKPLIRRLAVY